MTSLRYLSALAIVFFIPANKLQAQRSCPVIFSHNDYLQPSPFAAAYAVGVGYIEADVVLSGDTLYVAHQEDSLNTHHTLSSLYLDPLSKQVSKHSGQIYSSKGAQLALAIDVKTEPVKTLTAIIAEIEKYPSLLNCPSLHFIISGNLPPLALWNDFPGWIRFDGRPGIDYGESGWKRIALISTSFESCCSWTGHDKMNASEEQKIKLLVIEAHRRSLAFRFWAIPDFEDGWNKLIGLDVDIINSDHPEDVCRYLATPRKK